MASLEIAFEPLLGKPHKQQQQQQQNQINKKICKRISTVCPNCNTKEYVYITNDFIKTCGCAKCGHLFWKHGVTPQCNCGDCLKDCEII